jgi:hypothetical protein
VTYLHGHQVEAVVINWRRPDNVAEVVRALKAQTLPCTVTVCDCHDEPEFRLPRAALPYIDRLYRWRHNLGSFNRWVPLGAYDHRYTFFVDDDMVPGSRCVEHFWSQAEELRTFGALGQIGRIVAANGDYRADNVRRGPGFTEVDVLVRAFFVPTHCLTYVPQMRAMLGLSHDPEDDILLAVALSVQGGLASYLTPADPDPETLVNSRELPSPHARSARSGHSQARSGLLRDAIELGWRPIRARSRSAISGGAYDSQAGDGRGILYLAIGDTHRKLAVASITSLRRYGYQGPVRVITDQPDWLPPQLGCESVLVPHLGDGFATRHYKTQLESFAFDSTVFLDADAIPIADIADIWNVLDSCDLAMASDLHPSAADAITKNRTRDQWRDQWGDEYKLMIRLGLTSHPYFNSGVIVFRRTPQIAQLFSTWHQEWRRYGRADQMALLRAVALTGTPVKPLQGVWNFYARHYASIRDAQHAGVKVLHFLSGSRHAMSANLLSTLSDATRYLMGGDWERCELNNEGHRFAVPGADGSANRTSRPCPGGGFLAHTVADGASHLEMVVPGPEDGLRHYWREQSAPVQSWTGPIDLARECGRVTAASIVQAGDGNIELLVQADGKLARYWREPPPPSPWSGPDWIADDVAGNPSALRSDCDEWWRGALVVPSRTAGVRYLYRDGGSWIAGGVFGQERGRVDAVALAEGADGELVAVARTGPLLACYRLSPDQPGRWSGPEFVFRGAAGIPGLARNSYSRAGGLELLTPLPAGGMAHLWRDAEAGDARWRLTTHVGRWGPPVEAVSLTSWNGEGRPGDFAAVARAQGETRWYWRQDRLHNAWLSVSLW